MHSATLTPAAISDAEAYLDRALLRLPAQQRDAVLLRYAHDLSLDQIAQATQVPLETAKKRLHRAPHRPAGLLRVARLFRPGRSPGSPPLSTPSRPSPVPPQPSPR